MRYSLPTLRRKILKAFSLIVLLYAGLGVFLVIGVLLATKTTPKMLHVNYDSIVASAQMREAWSAIDHPNQYPQFSTDHWIKQFENALIFEEGNITEPGEKEITLEIRRIWEEFKKNSKSHHLTQFGKVNQLLSNLVTVNERGMFSLTEQNVRFSRNVLLGAILYFVLTLILAVFIADNLAQRLSKPLKAIAEALQKRPKVGKRLKLGEPNSLELFILNNELQYLWDRILQTEKLNIAEIVQQKSKLEALLESVEDALFVIDKAGYVSHCNQCLLSLVGLSIDMVKDQVWTDLPSLNENYLKMRAIIHESMPDGQEVELLYDGSIRQFAVRSRRIYSTSKQVIATLFLLHDISEKRQRERFRTELIDLLSHEIKTPLQSLGTASEFLCAHKNELPEIILPFVDTISEDVDRIRAVANEFVQVTQSHSKVMKLKLDRVPISVLLPEWIKPFYIVSRDYKVHLKLHLEGSEVIWACIDTVKFPWVISNLISNAIRFSPSEGEVTVLLTDRNGAVEIRVIDQGPGISEDDQKRMFEPFYQSSKVTSSSQKGLFGIGLTIAKEVVKAHDGRIEYYLAKPQGSDFRILLPFPAQSYG